MLADGTIVLRLLYDFGTALGHSRERFSPGDPDYELVLKHVGGLRPGEEKPVPPGL